MQCAVTSGYDRQIPSYVTTYTFTLTTPIMKAICLVNSLLMLHSHRQDIGEYFCAYVHRERTKHFCIHGHSSVWCHTNWQLNYGMDFENQDIRYVVLEH